MQTKENILESYHAQAHLLSEDINKLKAKINQFSFLRLGIFVSGILIIYLLFFLGWVAVATVVFCGLIAFLVVVKLQLKVQNEFDFKQVKHKLLNNEISILAGKANIYGIGDEYYDAKHPYSSDLDIFGKYSLFAYLNRCASAKAMDILAAWLSKAADKTQIEERQHAVAELANLREDILNFRSRLFKLPKAQFTFLQAFMHKNLRGMLAFIQQPRLLFILKFLPFINVSILICACFFNGVWWSLFGILLLINGVFYGFYKKRIDEIHERTAKTFGILENYAANLKWLETYEWQSSSLKNRVLKMNDGAPINQQINKLAKIIKNLDYRLNLVVGGFLNLVFQWDLHCIKRLENWHQKHAETVGESFNLMAEFEALISLATLKNNHPTWVKPQIKETYHFETVAIGHPLINENKRIVNDFALKDSAEVAIITGSNMAGKSTFLRTVGINMVLAFAGAQVCAAKFSTFIFNLVSYMRILDSLSSETSTFKAELDRLKMILQQTEDDPSVFVLIDEMLRGTNSRDKYLGSKVFITHLVNKNAPGFVATHDLQIADMEKDFPAKIRNFHFDISINNNEMFFDYKIKAGECQNFNAAILLKAIGLTIYN